MKKENKKAITRTAVLLYSLAAYGIPLAEQTLRFTSTAIVYTIRKRKSIIEYTFLINQDDSTKHLI